MEQPSRTVVIGLVQINNSFANQSYLPYSVCLLHGYVKQHSSNINRYKFLLPIYRRLPIEVMVKQLNSADIAAFSTYVWNIRSSLEVARRLKKINPKTLIIFGGPQVPNHAEGFLKENPFIDAVVHGEGEKSFLDLVENYPNRNFHEVGSVSYLDSSGSYIISPKNLRMKQITDIPSPYLDGTFAPLIEANPSENWIALWETNRGCPFSCSFCDWGSAVQSKILNFDMNRISSELKWFADHKINYVFCCDANFGIRPRDIDIAELMAKSKKENGFPKNVGVQNTKNTTDRSYKAQRILVDSGLSNGVTIALQSNNEETIKAIKRENISLETFQELQKRFNRDGIVTYTDIILGLPEETYESFTQGISMLIEGGQHNRIILSLLSILPNAEMGSHEYQKQYGLDIIKSRIVSTHGLVEDYGDNVFEMQDLVVGTATMPREEWTKAYRFGWMTNVLYYIKLLQIPMIIAHKQAGVSIKEMIDQFVFADQGRYPLIYEISDFFLKRAQEIQNGGPENVYMKDWLGIYWPDDEFIFIKLSIEGQLEQFYSESTSLMRRFLGSGISPELINDALRLNRMLLKQPFQTTDLSAEFDFDVLTYWRQIKTGEEHIPQNGRISYRIDRKKQAWKSWDEWMREVVWFRNRSGAYLYEEVAIDTQKEPLGLGAICPAN